MTLLAENGKGTVPPRVLFHIIAARYGTTPQAVREWPADDYLDAVNLLRVTGGK